MMKQLDLTYQLLDFSSLFYADSCHGMDTSPFIILLWHKGI